jgi:hypothetical protein
MSSRTDRAERSAAQAWDYLAAAMTSAADSAREAGKHTAGVASGTATDLADRASSTASDIADRAGSTASDFAGTLSGLAATASKKARKARKTAGKKGSKLSGRAQKKVNKAADEAWSRANLAANALSGSKPGRSWGLVIGAGLLGVAVGWVAATAGRAAVARRAEDEERELAETGLIITPAEEQS